MNLVHAAACSVAILGSGAIADAGSIIYVDDDAPPGGDGLSWATAHRFLRDALAAFPDDLAGHRAWAAISEDAGDAEGAMSALEAGLRRWRDDTRMQLRLATLYWRAGRAAEALDLARDAATRPRRRSLHAPGVGP